MFRLNNDMVNNYFISRTNYLYVLLYGSNSEFLRISLSLSNTEYPNLVNIKFFDVRTSDPSDLIKIIDSALPKTAVIIINFAHSANLGTNLEPYLIPHPRMSLLHGSSVISSQQVFSLSKMINSLEKYTAMSSVIFINLSCANIFGYLRREAAFDMCSGMLVHATTLTPKKYHVTIYDFFNDEGQPADDSTRPLILPTNYIPPLQELLTIDPELPLQLYTAEMLTKLVGSTNVDILDPSANPSDSNRCYFIVYYMP